MSTPGPPGLRPLAALTAVVVVAHLLALQEASLSLNAGDATPVRVAPLITRTVTPPTEPAQAAEPAPAPPAPRPVTPKPQATPKRPRPAPIAPSPAPSPISESNQPEPSTEASEPAIDSVANSTLTGTVTAAPPTAAVAPAEPASAAAAPAPLDGATLSAKAPASVRLLYNLNGRARKLDYTARGEVLWRQNGQRYELRLSVSAFLIGSRSQVSEGDITPQGLAPRRYADKWRGEQAAHFNRDTQRITFSANTPDAPLLPGAQDRLSLFIQIGALLAADPQRMAPGTRVTLQTVSTRDAEPWVITSDGEERLDLPDGEVKAFKFSRAPRREFDTRVELWYAPAKNYLPVRIQVTQANGDFLDQRLRATEPLDDLP